MADAGGAFSGDVGEHLRRVIARRRQARRRLAIAALILCGAGPPAVTISRKPPILLVWNASASAPVGLYRVRAAAPLRRGDMVVAWMAGPVRALAARRHYLPANVPLVKRVAALAGDRICARGAAVSINGRRAAERQRRDAAGRPMPWWNGCRRLAAGEQLLLMDHPWSFDGRYFGASRSSQIMGRAEIVWAKPAEGSNDG